MKRSAFFLGLGALALGAGAIASARSDISGTWHCQASGEGADHQHVGQLDVSFSVSGDDVRGSYYAGGGKLRGDLDGNVFEGTYQEPGNSRGNVRFVFADNGQSFEGSWSSDDGKYNGFWRGKRA